MKVGPYEASIGVHELERLYKLEEIKDLLPAIVTVCEKQKVMILVDELDRGWDASEDAKAFVAGLFQACIAINRLTPNLRVYMSLRQELFGHLVARTLHRPRELISFCTEVLETAQAMRQQPPFDYSVVSEAEMAYSEERTKDIAAEYRHQYPGLLSVFEHFRGGHSTLDRDELEQLCMELALGERRISEPAGWIVDQDPDSVIDVLWRVGFLTAKAGRSNPRAGTGGRFVGPHQVAHLTLANVREFQVHPMFRAYLGLTDEIVLDEAPPDRALNGRGPSRR